MTMTPEEFAEKIRGIISTNIDAGLVDPADAVIAAGIVMLFLTACLAPSAKEAVKGANALHRDMVRQLPEVWRSLNEPDATAH